MTFTPMSVFLALLAGWLGWLVVERVRLEWDRAAVPLRIAVTGSRGKTTVARLLAAVLREDGRKVLAKTTGSEARIIFPDGAETEVHRLGAPSVLEQRKLLARGARLGVDAVVAEVMSVHPEAHRVESRRILVPHLVLVTNFRVDHSAAQGDTRESVARVLALDVPPGGRALVPEEEWETVFAEEVGKGGGMVERVPAGAGAGGIRGAAPPVVVPAEAPVPAPGPAPALRASAGTPARPGAGGDCLDFGPNLDLVWAAARSLGIGDETIWAGVCRARGDIGTLRVWRYPRADGLPPWRVANAFAANEPESTLRIYDLVGADPATCVGLLALRPDRGDRTVQWIEALASGFLERFRRVYVHGLHAHALQRRLRKAEARTAAAGVTGGRAGPPGPDRVVILGDEPPHRIMQAILEAEGAEPGLLFGFGNIAGVGESLVRHWREVGEPVRPAVDPGSQEASDTPATPRGAGGSLAASAPRATRHLDPDGDHHGL